MKSISIPQQKGKAIIMTLTEKRMLYEARILQN